MCCNKNEFAFYGKQKSTETHFVVDMTKQKIGPRNFQNDNKMWMKNNDITSAFFKR